jgi:hypothetical protein
MKKIFILLLISGIHYVGFGQGWSNEELKKANTALNTDCLSSEEKAVIKYLNLARLYPQKFAVIEVKDYLGPSKYGDYLKTSSYKQSLLVKLQNNPPVGLLYYDQNMYLLAKCFAMESGESGKTGHNRISCSDGYEGECCSYGPDQGRDIALQLLIDHDVPSLGHRKICLDPLFLKVGVSIMPHTIYEYCSVLDFKRASTENIYNEPIRIKTLESAPKYQPANINNNEQTTSNEKRHTDKTKRYKLLSLKIGGGANLLFDDINTLNSSFSNQLSYQLNAMVGFNIGKSKRNTTIGIFGNYGKYNKNNALLLSNNPFSSIDNFLEIEGGFIIKEFLRLSGGIGFKSSNSINLLSGNYTTFTAGLSFGPKWFKFDINNALIMPKLNNNLIYRPSIGLSVVIGLLNKRKS